MQVEDTSWLESIKAVLYKDGEWDIYDVIYETLSRSRMSYLAFLKMASEGEGYSPSEGNGYVSDQDWDDPDEFSGVMFYFGEHETITMPPDRFVTIMRFITEAYVKANPVDEEKAFYYMDL